MLAAASPSAAQETVTYTYDSLGRLVGSSTSGGPSNGVAKSIQYDAADNRVNYTVTGVGGAPSGQQATLSVADSSGSEGSDIVFTVTKTGSQPASVWWHFLDHGAIYGTDYDSSGGFLEFAAGETSKTFTIRTFKDALTEPNEQVKVFLYNPTGATAARGEAFGTITDVGPPTLSVADTSGPEGTDLVFTVTKTGNEPARTFWHFLDHGAIYGTDYDGTGGYLEFAAGETSKTFTIRAFKDALTEPDEKVKVFLYNTAGATEARGEVFGTITDVAPPTLSVADTSGPEGTDLVFTVTKTGSQPASAWWHFVDHSAIYGTDYDSSGGFLEFAAGETSKTFTIRALTDAVAEPDEKVRVFLYNLTGATAARGEAFGTIVNVAP